MKYARISLIVLAAIFLSVVLFVATAFVFGFEEILPFVGSESTTVTTAPETTVPGTAAPGTTVPVTTVPGTTAPETTVPTDPTDGTTAPTLPPETTVPPTAPPETSAPSTAPTEPTTPPTLPPETTVPETEPKDPNLENEGSAMEDILRPAQITILRPTAPGILTESNASAIVDYSNMADGYIMVKFLKDFGVRLKVQVSGPSVKYTYNVDPLEWTVFPLSDGNGNYTVKLFRNVQDNKYSTVLSASFTVKLKDEFAPFLRPNQYVNYENQPLTASTASKVTHDGASMLEKVKAVYDYVVANISYDYQKAATVQSGYLPELDQILTSRKGICFDYAALMTGMLRSLNVPCKLVVGYAGTEYHAWISVWSEETGWIDGAIYFNGTNWQKMDPTFAATGSADAINRVTYTSKYIY